VIPDAIMGPVSNGSPVSNGKVPAQPAPAAVSRPDSASSVAASERDERRHQRTIVRERRVQERGAKTGDAQKRDAKSGDAPKRGGRTGERLNQARTQLEELSRRGRFTLGDTVSLGLIVVVVGVALGAILGALGAAGWIVGLLVATLTLGLSAALRHSRHKRPPRNQREQPEFVAATGAGH
jgi:Flp pilus assembly protein TadB